MSPFAVLRPREASIFACLVDTIVAPEPPLPPVAQTDAVAAFDTWLARAPRLNRVALRAALYAAEVGPRFAGLGARLRRLTPERRLEFVRRVERTKLAEAMRSTAAMSYFGDAGVMRLLGYEPAPPR